MKIYDAIKNFDGKAKIVSLVYQSDPSMVKGGRRNDKNEYPNRFYANDGTSRIHKLSQMNGIIGSSYENVTKNRSYVPEFKAEQLWGGKGEHINKYLVKHKTSHRVYLAFLLNSVSKTKYIWDSGKELSEEEIEEMYLWTDKKSSDSVVEWRVLPVDNILEMKMDGQVYSK